jgi:hypothetical protein
MNIIKKKLSNPKDSAFFLGLIFSSNQTYAFVILSGYFCDAWKRIFALNEYQLK